MNMIITKAIVAEQIAAYLHHQMTLEQLVDWAENALMNDEFAESDVETLSAVLARLGVADVRAFGLTWEDCEQLLGQLGFAVRVDVVTA
jgi:cobyrinic acid a,c-diamide synthase